MAPEENRIKVLDQTLEVKEGVTFTYDKGVFSFKGPKGENSRKLVSPIVETIIDGNKITLKPKVQSKKRENRMINTFIAHLKNLIKGVDEGYVYKLKVCSGHFPMNVSVSKTELTVKNFIGEKIPRTVKITPNVNVKLDGAEITVESVDKELAGQMAASIEQLTRRPGFDTRIFQDGIYIVEKDGKVLK